MTRFALVCGRPGTWAAKTQFLLLSSIASTSVRSIWTTSAPLNDCDMIRPPELEMAQSNLPAPQIMGSIGAAFHVPLAMCHSRGSGPDRKLALEVHGPRGFS